MTTTRKYHNVSFISVFYYLLLLLLPSRPGVYAYEETCNLSNKTCLGFFIVLLAGAIIYVLCLSYKCYKGWRETNTNGVMNRSTNSNDSLEHIDDDGSNNTTTTCNAIRNNQENSIVPPYQHIPCFERTEFNQQARLFKNKQKTNRQRWNNEITFSSSNNIDRFTREEYTVVQMNNLYDESRSDDMPLPPPPPYSANP